MNETTAVEVYDEHEAIREDLSRLRCVTSRTFRVCVACPHGDWVPGYGTPATARYTVPGFGRYGLCAKHDEEWSGRREVAR